MNKKVAPNVQDPTINKALNEIYNTLNELLSSSNFNKDNNISPSSGKIGDFKVVKDFQTKRYKLAGKGKDGWVVSPGYLQTGTGGILLNQAEFNLTKYDDISYKDTIFNILNENSSQSTSLKLGSLSSYALFNVNKTGDLAISSVGTGSSPLSLSKSVNGGDVSIKINNSYQDTGSVDETASLIFQHASIDAGWITSERTGMYSGTASTQDSTMTFYTETDSSKLQRLKLKGAYTIIGSGSGDAKFSSNGTQDLRLHTNEGTNSCEIHLVDGTNGGITVAPDGTGALVLGSSNGSIHFANNNLYDQNGNPWVTATATSSAVNNLTILNVAAGNSPKISATGSDDNLDLKLAAKGTGAVVADVSTGAMKLEYDGSNIVSLGVASDGHLTITTTGTDPDLTLDFDGTAIFNSGDADTSGAFSFQSNGTQRLSIDPAGTMTFNGSSGSVLEGLFFTSVANGVSTISTNDVGGTVGHLTLSPDGSLVLNPADGKFVAKNNGTEFSATDSAYAGMILGYTRLQGDLTNQGNFEIQNSITVEDDTHKVTFKTPPSENVEIEITCAINRATTDTTITAGLSDADASTGYNSIGVQFEYDYIGLGMSDDESDDEVVTAKWILGASELASVGSSNTFWIGFGTGGLTKSAWLTYGVRASHGICTHPFVIKATALPVSIYDG